MLIDESFMVDLFHHHTSHYATLDLFESRKEGKKFFKTISFGIPHISPSSDLTTLSSIDPPTSLSPSTLTHLLFTSTSRIGKWIAYYAFAL